MTDTLFRVMLDLFVCSDPWPLDEEAHTLMESYLDTESLERGYESWVVAFHEYVPTEVGHAPAANGGLDAR